MGTAREFLAKLTTRATVLFAIAAIACGLAGYSRLELSPGEGMSAKSPAGRVLDVAYLSLGMLTLGVKNAYGDPFLLAGRWFGVLFVFGAVSRMLLPRIGAAITRRRIASWRGHTIVVGLGGRGRAYLRDIARHGPVVGIDRNALEATEVAGAEGAPRLALLQGDAGARGVLERAHVAAAARVLLCTGDDLANDRVARRIVALARESRRGPDPLDLVVQYADAELGRELAASLPADALVHPRPVTPPALAARALLARWPSLLGGDRVLGGAGHWVFVGWDAFAEALLLSALRLPAPPGLGPRRWTIHCAEPDRVLARLAARHDAAGELLASVRTRAMTPAGRVDDDSMREDERGATVSAVFVFGASDPQAFALARRVRADADRVGCWRAPVFVRLDDELPFAAGLAPRAAVKRIDATIEAFGTNASTCTMAALRDGAERLAQALHAAYASTTPAHAGLARDWPLLPEPFRDANRRAVEHFAVKMGALGYLVRREWPLPHRPPALDASTMQDVARLEHESWMAEKRLEGWVGAPRRDDRRRHHDCLVPFDALDAAAQVKDLGAFRLLAGLDADREASARIAAAAAREPAGAGAFRERVIGVLARRGLTGDAVGLLAARVREWLAACEVARRLGPEDDEFWSIAVTMEPGGELAAARALWSALAAIHCVGPAARWRVVVVQAAPLALLAGAQAAAIAQEIVRQEAIEAWLAPAVGSEAASRAECRLATIDALCTRCNDLLVVDGPVSTPAPGVTEAGIDLDAAVQRWLAARDGDQARGARRALGPLRGGGLHRIDLARPT